MNSIRANVSISSNHHYYDGHGSVSLASAGVPYPPFLPRDFIPPIRGVRGRVFGPSVPPNAPSSGVPSRALELD